MSQVAQERAFRLARPRPAGFTLLELIVVITIIGILSTIVVISTRNIPAKGRRAQIDADMRNILTVANAIQTDTGRWPETIQEMTQDKYPDGRLAIAHLEKIPKDPWHNEYRYEVSDNQARVTCLGHDGQEGGDPGTEDEDVNLPEPIER